MNKVMLHSRLEPADVIVHLFPFLICCEVCYPQYQLQYIHPSLEIEGHLAVRGVSRGCGEAESPYTELSSERPRHSAPRRPS